MVNDGTTLLYRASKLDCQACTLKPRCCPKEPARKVPRSIYEGARDLARKVATTQAYAVSRRQRKKVERLFAHLKRILRLDRLRLRGPTGARDEFLLAHRPEPSQARQANPGPDAGPRHITGPIRFTRHANEAGRSFDAATRPTYSTESTQSGRTFFDACVRFSGSKRTLQVPHRQGPFVDGSGLFFGNCGEAGWRDRIWSSSSFL